jgi:cell wall assembly regulator SMI1
MYLEYFLRARDFLSQHGLKPRVVMGQPVSESDLKAVDAEIGVPMPSELRQFYLELGDGFAFIPDDSKNSQLVGWGYLHLADHRIGNKTFNQEVEEQAMPEINNPSRWTDPVLLRREMERRKLWIPFYGFGGGAYLCFDSFTKPATVRFFESVFWVDRSETWDFVIASSFSEFVEKWSQHHFLTPLGNWLIFSQGRKGTFDWSSEHFPIVGKSSEQSSS